jgi:hypothetical protein
MKVSPGKLAVIAASTGLIVAALMVRTSGRAEPPPPPVKKATKNVTAEERADALARAQIWRKPAVPISRAELGPQASQPNELSCRFQITDLNGTAQKFDCTLDDGQLIRVKYGHTPEIPSEVAASRLLRALGFAADEVNLVEKVRCHGCPLEPFVTLKAVDLTDTDEFYRKFVNYDNHKDFEWVAVERKHPGRPIGTDDTKGWAFFELDQVDAARGGAPRAHVDALRLLSVLIAHWDNKSENQRLVCDSEADWPEGENCRAPFVMLQDIGGAFGPRKVDLDGWRKAPIWDDRTQCITSMATMPYEGATFKPVRVSEAGRRHLASLLGDLSDDQLTALFSGARFDQSTGLLQTGKAATIPDWVAAFKHKVSEVSEGPPCPQ